MNKIIETFDPVHGFQLVRTPSEVNFHGQSISKVKSSVQLQKSADTNGLLLLLVCYEISLNKFGFLSHPNIKISIDIMTQYIHHSPFKICSG